MIRRAEQDKYTNPLRRGIFLFTTFGARRGKQLSLETTQNCFIRISYRWRFSSESILGMNDFVSAFKAEQVNLCKDLKSKPIVLTEKRTAE